MLDPRRDARIAELTLLAQLERAPKQRMSYRAKSRIERQLLLYLVQEGYVNGRDTLEIQLEPPDENQLDDRLALAHKLEVQRVTHGILAEQPVELILGHKGRLRLAELEQLLSTGRDRDPTGTFVSRRYFDRDLTVAITRAAPEQPVCLAIVDMNGLKALNDQHGHAAGDEAIRRYLTTIAAVLPQGATGYRGDGGDEVFVISRGVAADEMIVALRVALKALTHAVVCGETLSAACGLRVLTEPSESAAACVEQTDQAQYRAKAATHLGQTRCSTIAVGDGDAELI
jgi:diguanylate cyclase (GGDEF)-like protein